MTRARGRLVLGAVLAVLLATMAGPRSDAAEPDKVKVRLDWIIRGGHAMFFVAQEKGYFKAENIDLELIHKGNGSLNTATLVGTNQYDFGFADLPTLCVAKAKGVRYTLENRDDTINIMAKVAKHDRAEEEWVYDWFVRRKLMQPNGYVSPAALNWMQELNVRLGRQTKVMPIEQIATWEFQKQIVAELGEYKW